MIRFGKRYGFWTALWIAVCLFASGCGQRQEEAADGRSETVQGRRTESEVEAGSGAKNGVGSGAPVSGVETESEAESGEASGTPVSVEETGSAEEGAVPVLAEAEAVKEYLATFPYSPEELSGQPCYVAVHGKEISGREYVEEFMEKVQAGENAALVVVQYTIEGDPVFDYLSFCGEQTEQFYRLLDMSRDHWAGAEKYHEYAYTDVWTELGKPDKILEEGISEEEEQGIYFILYADNSYQDGLPQRIFCVEDGSLNIPVDN